MAQKEDLKFDKIEGEVHIQAVRDTEFDHVQISFEGEHEIYPVLPGQIIRVALPIPIDYN